jgi:uncharacterized protein YwgA
VTASQIVLKLFLDEIHVPLKLDSFENRFTVQKKTYLSQLSGFDLRYRFAWYVHGPYSRQLTADVFRLKQAIDDGEADQQGNTLGSLAKQLLRTAKSFWTNKPPQLSESDWLELLASLHYVRHIAYNPEGKPRDFVAAFATVVECKPKFSGRDGDARAAWEQLQSVGLIENKVLPQSKSVSQRR